MTQHKMVTVDGVRYRPEDVPKSAAGDDAKGEGSTPVLSTARVKRRRSTETASDTASPDTGAGGDTAEGGQGTEGEGDGSR